MKKRIIRLYNRGDSTAEIAERVGVSKPTVTKYIRQHKELIREWAELRSHSPQLIKEWNTLRDTGNSYQAIADVYNVPMFVVKQYVLEYRKERTIHPKPRGKANITREAI
ncbi:helix-turn-helix domain-containing protein [Peribacillus sp. YIM B13482]|uniref:helix-turn-helix domain-containing protein n=1 Tax=Peribacillus sp. YIM B13482 TaxID=3366298 RepID=UPI00366CCC7D